jgi:transcription termination/antitermination protein NusG
LRDTEEHPWFALKVRTCREKLVAESLRQKGFIEFLPLFRARRRWVDRFKEVECALFPGYLFCRVDPLNRLPVLITPGVISIIGVGKIPIPVDESEVAAIQAIVKSGLELGPWPFLEAGQRVRVEEGPLRGVEGVLIEVDKRGRLVASVTLLQRAVAVVIDRHWVRPILSAPLVGAGKAAPPSLRAGLPGRLASAS